jgi:hypothetical protein
MDSTDEPDPRLSDEEMDEVTHALQEEDVEGQRLRNASSSQNVRRLLYNIIKRLIICIKQHSAKSARSDCLVERSAALYVSTGNDDILAHSDQWHCPV